jgi:hypothetical protein
MQYRITIKCTGVYQENIQEFINTKGAFNDKMFIFGSVDTVSSIFYI